MDPSATRLLEASTHLEPADRALLSLWLDRDLDDAAIADLIASTPSKVAARRTALVHRLAEATGADSDHVRKEVECMAGRDRDEAAEAPRSATAGGPALPGGEGAAPSAVPLGLGMLLGIALLSALVFLLVITLGSEEPDRRSSPPVYAVPAPARAAAANSLILVAVAATSRTASGTGELAPGGALRLSIRGLAPGRYEVWAFNSIRQARPLATFRGPAATVRSTMPAGRYRFLDVSREPDDGNPAHSGQSVLRAQL